MFGSSVDHIRGKFDSFEETKVAEILIKMRREKYLKGFLPHPKVAGVTADFLIQLGPESDNEGELILVEYDGLGIDRPKGLSAKRRRYRNLSKHGFSARWLTEPTREAIEELILDYTHPRFAIRKDVCDDCGDVEGHLVIAGEDSSGELIRRVTCDSCAEPTPQSE
jgi:hypothetical protein